MTKHQEPTKGTARAVEVNEEEVQRVRVILLAAYLLVFAAFAAIVYARGELIDWIAD